MWTTSQTTNQFQSTGTKLEGLQIADSDWKSFCCNKTISYYLCKEFLNKLTCATENLKVEGL